MLRRVLALALKELLALVRDRKSRFVLVGPPVFQLLVFGYAATFDLGHVAYAVYDADHGPAARALLARFEGAPAFELAGAVDDERALAALVDERRVLLVLRIAPGFGARLERGEPARLQAIVDGRNSNTALVLLGYVRRIVSDFNAEWAAAHGHAAAPARLETHAWFNPNLESRWFIVPGIVGLLTLVVALLVTALSVAREREAGTFDQLLVTPLRPIDLILGKALPGFLIGVLEASFIVAVAVLWFGVPLRGSLPALYLGLLLFLFSAIGVGLAISSVAVTQQQGLLGAFLFLVPAVILSGFATPIANMPPVVQYLTRLDPLRYFLVILRGVFLEGDSFALLASQFWPMALIGVTTLTVAGWLFRHRMY